MGRGGDVILTASWQEVWCTMSTCIWCQGNMSYAEMVFSIVTKAC